MRIANFVLTVLFILFAFVQINDPDPILWILIYGSMSVICLLAAFEFYPVKVLYFLGVAYFLYALYYFPGLQDWLASEDRTKLFDNLAKMEFSYIEESREFLGLMICVVVIAWQIYRSRHSRIPYTRS